MQRIAELIRDPKQVRRIAEAKQVPVPFSMVHAAELRQIDATRIECGRAEVTRRTPSGDGALLARAPSPAIASAPDSPAVAPPVAHPPAPLRGALDRNLVGLAFSGGGIRSATFNLGVLQGLLDTDGEPVVGKPPKSLLVKAPLIRPDQSRSGSGGSTSS